MRSIPLPDHLQGLYGEALEWLAGAEPKPLMAAEAMVALRPSRQDLDELLEYQREFCLAIHENDGTYALEWDDMYLRWREAVWTARERIGGSTG